MKIDFTKGKAMTEAVEYATFREVILPDVYYGEIVGIAKQKAVSIAGLASLEQIKFIIDLVTKAIDDGGTFKDFQKAVRSGSVSLSLPDYRLENIFRTNMQVAYNRGRWQQQEQAASSRPYLMYDAINDSRTRPSHLAMDGTVLHRSDPWWSTHYPPCGYQCRCTVISLTEKQAQKRGVSAAGPDVDPDEGWAFNPGLDYQESLDDAIREFGSDLVEEQHALAAPLAKAKSTIRDLAAAAKSDRSDAPRKH